MVKQLNKALDEVIQCIIESNDYKECIRLKNAMSKNNNIINLVSNIKTLQKEYVRSNYDDTLKKELDEVEKKLLDIPIYSSYIQHLEKVNEMINYVRDELNNYFYKVLNQWDK